MSLIQLIIIFTILTEFYADPIYVRKYDFVDLAPVKLKLALHVSYKLL